MSAISNDISYDDVFLYQAERLMQKGDILILISSSGNSKNIKKVLKFTNKKKILITNINFILNLNVQEI
mgnify:CR=1 FL=1